MTGTLSLFLDFAFSTIFCLAINLCKLLTFFFLFSCIEFCFQILMFICIQTTLPHNLADKNSFNYRFLFNGLFSFLFWNLKSQMFVRSFTFVSNQSNTKIVVFKPLSLLTGPIFT